MIFHIIISLYFLTVLSDNMELGFSHRFSMFFVYISLFKQQRMVPAILQSNILKVLCCSLTLFTLLLFACALCLPALDFSCNFTDYLWCCSYQVIYLCAKFTLKANGKVMQCFSLISICSIPLTLPSIQVCTQIT